ncbi:penicillin-binding transpeptidase domain-containing protein [Arthrobacter psychrolactophilus]
MPRLQNAAEEALASVKTPSSIVVMRPSSGAILASANGPDSNGYNTAFLGQYAPGSTFKIATSLGLFRLGMTPASTVNCSTEYTADGKKFLNAPGYAAEASGEVPLTTAVAHSCNTAFVSEFEKLAQDQLADAAGALGIGMSNDLGLEAFTGAVPRDSAGTEHAASMIGQGKVLVSPLAMTTLMSSVVKGSAVAPVLVEGHDGKVQAAAGAALTEKEAGDLRTLMRAVVTDGYLNNLADLPGAPAIGKTGPLNTALTLRRARTRGSLRRRAILPWRYLLKTATWAPSRVGLWRKPFWQPQLASSADPFPAPWRWHRRGS